jgi:DNA invertase Pin-like site-specific DNA recombinase
LRVSSDKQSTECQRPEVEHLARARGYEVFTSYEEEASAAKKRPEYERMMKDAKRGAFQVLVIWALDRFGRSMTGNLADVLELDRIGVQVVSVRESWLDTGSPVRTLLIAIFSWVAEQERNRLVERTKAGLVAARRSVRPASPPFSTASAA